jgi:crossover junction endodeoxyribonuclease RuvC
VISIGIDPGKSGGIAWIEDGEPAQAVKMPATEADIYDKIHTLQAVQFCRDGTLPFAVIEKVHAMPKQGVTSTFTFGKNYGALLMALTAAGIPFEEVLPGTWMRGLGCLTKGDKNVSKRKAQQLFPHLKVTHAIADALLIAEWGRRQR